MQTLEREDLQYIREDLTTVLFIPKGVEMPPIHEEEYGKKIQLGTNVSEKGEKMFSSVSVE